MSQESPIILPPTLLSTTGMAGAGKSTICKAMAKTIANSLYLDRDEITFGLMQVTPTKSTELPDFEDYVASDAVFPNNAKKVSTSFGEMIKIYPGNAYYARHGKHQSYLVIQRLCNDNLKLGKVVVIDSFLDRHIKDGTLKNFLEQDQFTDYRKYHIHIVASPETCFDRHLGREATYTEEGAFLRRDLSTDRDRFMYELAQNYQANPEGINELSHLVLDTTALTIEESVKKGIDYILSGNSK